MEDNTKIIESLLERATEFGRTTIDLAKLKVLDKTSDVVSSFLPHYLVIIILSTFLFFLSLGIAVWLGEILGKSYLGFFVVAFFYFITGILVYFLFFKRIKKYIQDKIIKKVYQ
jgi:hypothetical protein